MSAGDSEQQPVMADGSTDPKALRASYSDNLTSSWKHICEALGSEGKNTRTSDLVSILLLPVASITLAICSAAPGGLAVRPFMVVAFCLALMYYIGGRIGILKSLTMRQTHLVLQIISATFMLGAAFSLLMYEIMRITHT